MNRRQFGGLIAATATVGPAGLAVADDKKPQAGEDKFPVMHNGRRPEIGMLLYPGMTLMDLLGPQTVLSTSCNVHLVWKNTELIESDSGVILKPTGKLGDCPKDLDVLFVGGGPGQLAVMSDPEVLKFMADRGARAKYVTSVCTGSLILGAAGLLRGYKATSHWAFHDALALFGATPVTARVVTDRNRISGGGVTAGIDFGLTLLAKMLGDDMAKMTQLALEYDPQPPFDAGTPKKAGKEIIKKMEEWVGPFGGKMTASCVAAAKVMGEYTPEKK
ncbi:DJ-1/PfpI family protein [Zavarzinella formosa]|uniref:DJ-1/PfpI family protein n=1 Tax=Zavarzinella formosa TaxID=360055 RepID=UPI00030C43D2|nr:DJ-1/PfpI family protein [Zavarzinella formosa]